MILTNSLQMRLREKFQISIIAVLALVTASLVLENMDSIQTSLNVSSDRDQNIFHKAEATDTVSSTQHIETKTESRNNVYTDIYNQVAGSVVQITSTRSNAESHIIINGNLLEEKTVGFGSGFVYDELGHIITNNHVIEDSDLVEVTFNSGNTYEAKIIGTDAYNDIAVLEITDDFDENIMPLDLADSSHLMVGEPAVAIGNPFGLSNTMTTGIISQTGRLLPSLESRGFSIPNVIQTDAAINPGNSGGPLLDINGKVVGMNTAIHTVTGEFSGIGFAVPSNTIHKIIPVLIKEGTYKHPWIGITGMDITSKIAEILDLPKNYKGVAIVNIIEDSPADKAGMKEAVYNNKQEIMGADIIIGVDGNTVNTMGDVIRYISEKSVDDRILFTINRDDKTVDLYVILASRPDIVS